MKHIQAILLWILLFFFIRLPLILLGFIVVPIAYPFRTDNKFPKWAWIYDNDEDGIYGAAWFNKGVYDFKTCYKWSAIRNPVNNMRFVSLFTVNHNRMSSYTSKGYRSVPSPKLSRELGKAIWHYTIVKQKYFWYFSFWYIKAKSDNKHFRIRLGWKCHPLWVLNEPHNKIKQYSGITFQLMPNREG